jgi:glutamate synthase domain-containing protein 3
LYLRISERARVNHEYLEPCELEPEAAAELRAMLERHLAHTGSATAAAVLNDWERAKLDFVLARVRSSPTPAHTQLPPVRRTGSTR